MKIVEFKDYDNQTTPLSAYNLNRLQQNLITTKYQMTFSSAVSGGSTITLPCYYQVGQDTLDVYLNSELLKKASTKDSEGHYYEVGNSDTKSNQIKITSDWSIASGDVLNLIVRGTTDSYDQNLSPDKATQLADEISANKEEITALQTENSRLKGITNALPKISGEDTSLTLTNTANAPLSDIILKGNTSQNGEPTPSAPVDVNVVSGSNVVSTSNKNLFNAQIQAGTYGQATYSVARDGLITQSASDTSGWSTTQTNDFYLDAGTYTINCIGKGYEKRLQMRNLTDNVDIIITQSEKETFTLTERKLLAIRTWGNSTYPASYYVQIEKGSEATTYEPHQGKEFPLDLPVENLFDESLITSTSSSIKYIPIQCQANTDYTLSTNNVASSTATNLFLSTQDSGVTSANNGAYINSPRTINSGNNTTIYVGYRNNLSNNWIQLEKGSSASPYHPYGTDPIELCKIGDYHDYFYKSGSKWYLHKEIGKVVLNGTEEWKQSGVASAVHNINLPDMLPVANNNTVYNNGISDQFKNGATYQQLTTGTYSNYYNRMSATNDKYMSFSYEFTTTTASWKNWLTTHNLTTYYVLETPIDEEITDTTLITQLNALYNAYTYNDTTNISQTNANLPFYINAEAFKKIS